MITPLATVPIEGDYHNHTPIVGTGALAAKYPDDVGSSRKAFQDAPHDPDRLNRLGIFPGDAIMRDMSADR